jgi:2-hydroxy-3-keto-5-methylthiopentenyl-1-phosphate phosphatase
MKFSALVASDWNECLAPCGPFDPILFVYPELSDSLTEIFRMYTSNRITLGEAVGRIREILPGPVTEERMDEYLERSFVTYKGVPALIEWCLHRGILFMINTTGTQGYFQRILQRSLLPAGVLVAANPLIRYLAAGGDEHPLLDVLEIQDKARNTEAVIRSYGIPAERVILIGDSGGDGPHFEWGESAGAHLIGSMTKPSLEHYCTARGITIHTRFGISYAEDDPRDPDREMRVDFMGLAPIIKAILKP